MACLRNLEQREGLFYQCQGLRCVAKAWGVDENFGIKDELKKINLRR